MPNNYYERQSEMDPGGLADGLAIEQEFDAIGRGFSKLPAPHRDGRGFEGPTRVGDPVDEADAVNLKALEKLNIPIYRKKITSEDWNTITDAGIYDVVNATGANRAPGNTYGFLVVHSFNGVVSQLYYADVSSLYFITKRTCSNISTQSWSLWDGSLPVSKIVGPVDGGSVIERGSNANGEYVKFADGTLLCSHAFVADASGIVRWNYPVAVVGTPRPVATIEGVSPGAVTNQITANAQFSVHRAFGSSGAPFPSAVISAFLKANWK